MIPHRFLGGSSILSSALILQIMVPVLPQPCTRLITSQHIKLPAEQQVLAQTVCKFSHDNVSEQNVLSHSWLMY